MEERAKKIANDAGIKWTLIVGAIGTIATLIFSHIHDSGIDDLKAKIGVLEEKINVMKVDNRLSDLEKKFAAARAADRLTDLEQKVNNK